jgi:hypothetical protein
MVATGCCEAGGAVVVAGVLTLGFFTDGFAGAAPPHEAIQPDITIIIIDVRTNSFFTVTYLLFRQRPHYR